MTAILTTDKLTKTYRNGKGVTDISLTVESGTIFGLLGPNGAGKSTFVKMAVGLIMPVSGSGSVAGSPIGSIEARRQIGYLPELFRFQDWLTPLELLRYHAFLCGFEASSVRSASFLERCRGLLAQVGLADTEKRRVGTFSKGMQQRLGLALALLADPPLLMLDEPASALDPVGRFEVRELLSALRKQGKTIFLNTHLLEDVQDICDEAAFLSQGILRVQGPVRELLGGVSWSFRVGGWLAESEALLLADPIAGSVVRAVRDLGDGYAVIEAAIDEEAQAGWLNALIVEQGLTLIESSPAKRDLESWFLAMTRGGEPV